MIAIRRRRRVVLFAALLALPAAAFLLLRWALQPERLGALLLERAEQASGLTLAVSEPATLGVWPRLQLQLIGLVASNERQRLLSAERVDVGLPLSLLWSGGELDIGELHLLAPRIDVDALRGWLAQRPAPADSGRWQLPGYAFALSIERGRLLVGERQIEALELVASPLAERNPFSAQLSATLSQPDGSIVPIALDIAATVSDDGERLYVDALQLLAGTAAQPEAVTITGNATLRSADRFEVELQFKIAEAWPQEWPALPAPFAGMLPGHAFRIELLRQAPAAPRLAIASESADLDLSLQGDPAELIGWWRDPARSALPPMSGTLDLARWSQDGIDVEGLQVELRDSSAGEGEPEQAP